MRTRRAVVSLVLGPVLVLAGACSSEDDGLNPQPLPPSDGKQGSESPSPPARGGGATAADSNCTGTCCEKPAEGSACQSGTDTTCSWAVTCPTGLVIPYEITCTSGTWKLTNGCPAEGETDARGCPASNPLTGTPCPSPSPNQFQQLQCGYVLECPNYRKSAQATCSNGNVQNVYVWTSTPLGSCD